MENDKALSIFNFSKSKLYTNGEKYEVEGSINSLGLNKLKIIPVNHVFLFT